MRNYTNHTPWCALTRVDLGREQSLNEEKMSWRNTEMMSRPCLLEAAVTCARTSDYHNGYAQIKRTKFEVRDLLLKLGKRRGEICSPLLKRARIGAPINAGTSTSISPIWVCALT